MNVHRTYTIAFFLFFTASNGVAQCPGTVDTLFTNDFELNDGGLINGGGMDWEYGDTPTILVDSASCTTIYNDPPGPYSGAKGWATVLRGCYQNLGAESTLALTVDLSDPDFQSAELTWAQWYEVFTNFDYIFIRVNGIEVYMNDTNGLLPAWETRVVDLSSFVGQATVNIEFVLFATTVVNKAGWYLDDLAVTACSVNTSSMGEAQGQFSTLHLMPVPAADLVTVSSAQLPLVRTITLLDAAGRSVRKWEGKYGTTAQLDLTGILPGSYLVQAEGRGLRMQQRLIVR